MPGPLGVRLVICLIFAVPYTRQSLSFVSFDSFATAYGAYAQTFRS